MKALTQKIEDATALRELYGEPMHIAVAIEKDSLDEHHRLFIENSPFICLASVNADGQPSVSPKGDAPGFVQVLDEHTLVIPDRPGNNKVVSFGNILQNPKVSIIFFVPGVRESLRVEGRASIVQDDDMLELGRLGKSVPKSATVIEVTKAYMHCGKALIRSKVWDAKTHIEQGVIPPFGQIIKDQAGPPMPVNEVQNVINKEYKDNLY